MKGCYPNPSLALQIQFNSKDLGRELAQMGTAYEGMSSIAKYGRGFALDDFLKSPNLRTFSISNPFRCKITSKDLRSNGLFDLSITDGGDFSKVEDHLRFPTAPRRFHHVVSDMSVEPSGGGILSQQFQDNNRCLRSCLSRERMPGID